MNCCWPFLLFLLLGKIIVDLLKNFTKSRVYCITVVFLFFLFAWASLKKLHLLQILFLKKWRRTFALCCFCLKMIVFQGSCSCLTKNLNKEKWHFIEHCKNMTFKAYWRFFCKTSLKSSSQLAVSSIFFGRCRFSF